MHKGVIFGLFQPQEIRDTMSTTDAGAYPLDEWLIKMINNGEALCTLSSQQAAELEALGKYLLELIYTLDCTLHDLRVVNYGPHELTLTLTDRLRVISLRLSADGSCLLGVRILNGKPPSHALQKILDETGEHPYERGEQAQVEASELWPEPRYIEDHLSFREWFPDRYLLYTFLFMLRVELQASNRH